MNAYILRQGRRAPRATGARADDVARLGAAGVVTKLEIPRRQRLRSTIPISAASSKS